MKLYYISNNMFGDSLWSLSYYLEYCRRDGAQLIYLPWSIIFKLNREFKFDKSIIEAKLSVCNLILLYFASRIGAFAYNRVHAKILKSIGDEDLAYPIVNQNIKYDFSKKISGEDNSTALKSYLASDPRFYSFGYINKHNLAQTVLAKIIKAKLDSFNHIVLPKKYVVINLKPKTLRQRVGIRGSFRSSTNWHDITLAVEYLKENGYDYYNSQARTWSESSKCIYPVGHDCPDILINFLYVYRSNFIISSRTGFTLIAAILDVPCLELNAIDLPFQINSKGYIALGKIESKNGKNLSFREVLESEYFYNADYNCVAGYNQSKLSKSGVLDAVKSTVLDLQNRRNNYINTAEYTGAKHLLLHVTPQNILYEFR